MLKIPRLKEISYSYSPHNDNISGIDDDDLTWIEGEQELSFCTNVNWVSVTHISDEPIQIRGTLILSNFRLRFLPEDPKLRRTSSINKLLSKFDIVLYNVEAIYKTKKKKKKLLHPECLLKEKVDRLEIMCKTFQTVILDLQSTSEDDNNRIIYLLIEAVVTSQTDSLMVYARHPDDDHVEESNLESYWQNELKKCGETSYRAVTCNESFHVTDSLPKTFVVPSSLSPKDVVAMATKFIKNRCPCWTYSYKSSGTALIRMSYKILGMQNNVEEKIFDSIRSSHPYREYPKVFDLSSELPNLNEIQSSFILLQQLCVYDSTKSLLDLRWLSQLENSHWLEMISRCLNMAKEISILMSNKGLSVVIKEYSSTDLSPLMSSLVQLMLEEECRTMKGFEALIKKEWLAQGHKFGNRLQSKAYGLGNDPCPVFLLYLDCVFQLMSMRPSTFEFNSNYLILLWHSTCQGIFRDLLFNSPKDLFYTAMKVQMEFIDGSNLLRRNQFNRTSASRLSHKSQVDPGVVGTLMRKSHLDFSTLKKQMSSLTNLSQSQSMFSPTTNTSYHGYDSFSLKKNRSKHSRLSTFSINNQLTNSPNFSNCHLHLTPTSTCSSDWSELSTDLRSLKKSSQSHQRLNSSQILNQLDASYDNPWTDMIGEISRGGGAKLWDWSFLYEPSQLLPFKSFDYLADQMKMEINNESMINNGSITNNVSINHVKTLTCNSSKKFQKSALIIKGKKIYNYTSFVQDVKAPSDFLKMTYSVPQLRFWSACYLGFHPLGCCTTCGSSSGFKVFDLHSNFEDSQLVFIDLVSRIKELEKCLELWSID